MRGSFKIGSLALYANQNAGQQSGLEASNNIQRKWRSQNLDSCENCRDSDGMFSQVKETANGLTQTQCWAQLAAEG